MKTKRPKRVLKKRRKGELEIKGVKERIETKFSIPKLSEHKREKEIIKGPKRRR